jgi:hypothetical protein
MILRINPIYVMLFIVSMVLMTLKLTDEIDTSWWWVWAPLWIPTAIWLILLGIAKAIDATESPEDKKRREVLESLRKTYGR